MDKVNFETLVGQVVAIFSIALLGATTPAFVTVRGVDHGGVWFESQEITDQLLGGVGTTMLARTALTYLPFWRISLACCGMDVPSISTESIEQ
jgi:hypothetical protein